jgi:hypothetical protein
VIAGFVATFDVTAVPSPAVARTEVTNDDPLGEDAVGTTTGLTAMI